ncbi:MAG: cytochrome c [Verrucomicrobiales bacterium]|nr:cytochrome c [Verrucomicrobiales bacterium]
MRYFLALFAVTCVLVVAVAGRRGDMSRRPPIEIWNDMDRQLKLRPQAVAGHPVWEDGRTSRRWVDGTVPRLAPIKVGGKEIHAFEDHPVVTGREPGKTNYVELNPLPVTEKFMARGKERYGIYCAPCHGDTGDGNGVLKKFGHGAIASLTDELRVKHPDGYLFQVIKGGSPSGLMGPYGSQVEPEDRWAIIAYVRALQLARLGKLDDLPEPLRASLK